MEKELRIGNLLNGTHGVYRVNYLQDSHKDEDKIWAWCIESNKDMYGATEEALMPIPLTEEILLKCGFRKVKVQGVGSYQYYLNIWKYYRISIRQDMCIYLPWLPNNGYAGKYLHQLQNLYFALTQQELEINL
jgi:hypothetical protein